MTNTNRSLPKHVIRENYSPPAPERWPAFLCIFCTDWDIRDLLSHILLPPFVPLQIINIKDDNSIKKINRSDIWYIDLSKVKKSKKITTCLLVCISSENCSLRKTGSKGFYCIYALSDRWNVLPPPQDTTVGRQQGMS